MFTSYEKYYFALKEIPPPGTGCHPFLLKVANLGRIAFIRRDQVEKDLLKYIPAGDRVVEVREVQEACAKAFSIAPHVRVPQVQFDPVLLEKMLAKGAGVTEADIRSKSPCPIPVDPREQTALVLEHLFSPTDYVFMGPLRGWIVRQVKDWLVSVQTGRHEMDFIAPNPMTGELAKCTCGKESWRCDASVKDFRFAVVEFDTLTKEQQYGFWVTVDLPVVALIDSGNKSIHGWIRVDCKSLEGWDEKVKQKLFDENLSPLGVDSSCRNPSRLSRTPGVYRKDKGAWQKLLYFAGKEGRRVVPCIGVK